MRGLNCFVGIGLAVYVDCELETLASFGIVVDLVDVEVGGFFVQRCCFLIITRILELICCWGGQFCVCINRSLERLPANFSVSVPSKYLSSFPNPNQAFFAELSCFLACFNVFSASDMIEECKEACR